MKNFINPADIDSVIEKFDTLLLDGYWKYRNQNQKYFQSSKLEGFNINDFIQESENLLNLWYTEVLKVFETIQSEKHLFFHFVQHKGDGLVKSGMPMQLSNTQIAFEYYLYALEDVILRLEERKNLAVRQEIAEREYPADLLYKITYSDHTREVKLNDIILTKTDFNSENDNCFHYTYANPNRPIGIEELENATGELLRMLMTNSFSHSMKKR